MMDEGRILFAAALLLTFALCMRGSIGCIATAHGAERVVVGHRTASLHPESFDLVRVGALEFRGGIEIVSKDKRLGGLSALHISGDGTRMAALSDTGYWFAAGLHYDSRGRLVGIGNGVVGRLIDPLGKPLLEKPLADAEAIAPVAGGFVVAFEHRHRLWLYPGGKASFAAPPRPLASPPDLSRARANQGIEALARLADGRLFAIAEDLKAGPDAYRAWIGGGENPISWGLLSYEGTGLFRPVGAATLPSGDVVVLERRFTWVGGVASRLVRVAAADIVPGARLKGIELAVLDRPLTAANFEGIAAILGVNGATLLYLVSDDNYWALQRTLLFLFALSPP